MQILLLILLLALPALAHGEQEDTSLVVRLVGRRLLLDYTTKFPNVKGYTLLRRMDKDGDGTYSEVERTAFLDDRGQALLSRLDARQGEAALTPRLVEKRAEVESTGPGLDQLSVKFTVELDLPRDPVEGKTVHLTDPVVGWDEVELSGVSGRVEGDIPGDRITISFTESEGSGAAASHDSHSEDNRLMGLVSGELTPTVLAGTLVLAFVLGALHAMTPGHGKTLVAAYLVGSRGTVVQAVLLGVVVTVTHTLSVFLLGLACLFAFQYVVPDKIIPWLGFLSGLMVTGVGVALLWARSTGRELFHGHSHENGHGHSHAHSHPHPPRPDDFQQVEVVSFSEGPDPRSAVELPHHSHSHTHHGHTEPIEDNSAPTTLSPEASEGNGVSLWTLLSLGVSGGMVPCPEALAVLLGAISLNRLLLGMAVLVSFSLGLASLLILVGVFVVLAGNRVSKRYYPSDETIRKVSLVSYCFICLLGLVIAFRSLTSAGILVINP